MPSLRSLAAAGLALTLLALGACSKGGDGADLAARDEAAVRAALGDEDAAPGAAGTPGGSPVALSARAAKAAAERPEGALGDATEMIEILSADEMKSYLGALAELMKIDKNFAAASGQDPSALQQFAAGLAFQSKWNDVIDEFDMDQEEFLSVHYNVMMAYASEMMAEAGERLGGQFGKQMEQMDKLKGMVGEEQMKEMMAGLEQAREQLQQLQAAVPEENRELVRKFRTELDALLHRK